MICQLTLAQEVKLSKFQGDTVAIVPIETLNNINTQLKTTRDLKQSLRFAYNKINIQKKEISLLKDSLNKQNASCVLVERKLKKSDWEYIRAVNRYERAEKKMFEQKRYMIGGGIIAGGILILTLILK